MLNPSIPSLWALLAATRAAALRLRLELDLATFSLSPPSLLPAVPLLSAQLGGSEVLCLNCDAELFSQWLVRGVSQQLAAGNGSSGAKHPNAPGYKAWASLLSTVPVAASHVQYSELVQLRPKLRALWAERRLVVGLGVNPLHQRMDLVEVLVHLARNSPALAAAPADLRLALEATFGSAFLANLTHNAWLPVQEQRRRVQTLLSALKHSFRFYRQGCLAGGSCNGSSQLLGQIACAPAEDTADDACVYAELRHCNCGAFFEYARLHGPLALLRTRLSRDWVMGQCEEFSRAGHALFTQLGYNARYVLDFTDHVWLEVWLGGKWVHADPSEAVLDSPLMYEGGWGKKLSMIFAFTPSYAEHVTASYTADYPATVHRQRPWLVAAAPTAAMCRAATGCCAGVCLRSSCGKR